MNTSRRYGHPLSFLSLIILLIFMSVPVRAQMQDEWWALDWLIKSAHSPSFVVRDTVNKYGRYADRTKAISLSDLIKFHGHFCGGLVESAGSLRLAFDNLFPDGIVDRTDLRIASNNSACGGDVAAYLTGARTRFGAHLIDPKLTESEFVVQQVSTGKTVRVRVRPIESGSFMPEDIDLFQDLQWAYARKIVSRPLGETFVLLESADYVWPDAPCKNFGTRKDNSFKAVK